MATLVLTAVGTAVGGPIGGAIGAVIGQAADQAIFAPKPRQGPRLGELAVQTSSYGSAIPKLFGTMRVAGTVIWSTDLIEHHATTGGGKGRPGTVEYSYSASFAVALSGRAIQSLGRIWADGKLLRGAAGDFKSRTGFRLHLGDEDQLADALIASAEGAGQAPAYRGIAYAVFEDFELADYGNRIPSLTFEVVADEGPVAVGQIAQVLSGGAVVAGESPALDGFAASGDSIAGALRDLTELAGLSLRDEGSALRLGRPDGSPAAIEGSRIGPGMELVRRAADTLPGEVSIAYHEVNRDYQTGLQRAAVAGPVPEQRSERRALAAAVSAQAAKAFAERRLAALWARRASASVTVGWRDAGLRPGTLVTLGGEPGRWRVESWTLGPMQVRLEMVREAAASIPAAIPAAPGRSVAEPDMEIGATTLRAYDLPLGDGARERPFVAMLAAGATPGWRRAGLSASYDGGASWASLGGSAGPAILGSAVTALSPGTAALFDLRSSVEVELIGGHMWLEGRSDDALVAGANLALVGEELVQFGAVEVLGERRFRLSRLLRGRRGTEWAAGGHVVGEDFALLDPAHMLLLEPPAGIAGGEAQLLASGVGDEAEAASASVAIAGEALRPPSPVHLRARRTAGGDIAIDWVRRSRQGWSWPSGTDTPLGEESERYLVTLSGAGWQRGIESGASSCIYTAVAQAADGAAGPMLIEVAQIGTFAMSRPAVLTFE